MVVFVLVGVLIDFFKLSSCIINISCCHWINHWFSILFPPPTALCLQQWRKKQPQWGGGTQHQTWQTWSPEQTCGEGQDPSPQCESHMGYVPWAVPGLWAASLTWNERELRLIIYLQLLLLQEKYSTLPKTMFILGLLYHSGGGHSFLRSSDCCGNTLWVYCDV